MCIVVLTLSSVSCLCTYSVAIVHRSNRRLLLVRCRRSRRVTPGGVYSVFQNAVVRPKTTGRAWAVQSSTGCIGGDSGGVDSVAAPRRRRTAVPTTAFTDESNRRVARVSPPIKLAPSISRGSPANRVRCVSQGRYQVFCPAVASNGGSSCARMLMPSDCRKRCNRSSSKASDSSWFVSGLTSPGTRTQHSSPSMSKWR